MNGVQGVASSNLVIPTRISGSCDGESRLPFLLKFFRSGLSSRRAVFSRAAGPLRVISRLASRGRVASFLACLFLHALVRQPRCLRKSQSCLQKRGEDAPWKNVLGAFPRCSKRFSRTKGCRTKRSAHRETRLSAIRCWRRRICRFSPTGTMRAVSTASSSRLALSPSS